MADRVEIALTGDERRLLRSGVREWGGPARCTDAFAVAMGFADTADLLAQAPRLSAALRDAEPLSDTDWRRAVLMTEVVFASDQVGSGLDWETTTGIDDMTALRTLRAVQRKLLIATQND